MNWHNIYLYWTFLSFMFALVAGIVAGIASDYGELRMAYKVSLVISVASLVIFGALAVGGVK